MFFPLSRETEWILIWWGRSLSLSLALPTSFNNKNTYTTANQKQDFLWYIVFEEFIPASHIWLEILNKKTLINRLNYSKVVHYLFVVNIFHFGLRIWVQKKTENMDLSREIKYTLPLQQRLERKARSRHKHFFALSNDTET